MVLGDLVLMTRPEGIGGGGARGRGRGRAAGRGRGRVALRLRLGTGAPAPSGRGQALGCGRARALRRTPPLRVGRGALLLPARSPRQGLRAGPELPVLAEPREPSDETASLVYTDRSIYRPQQKLLWKVVAYGGRRRSRAFPRGGRRAGHRHPAATPTTRRSRRRPLKTNAFGSAAGEFTIPAGRLLGALAGRELDAGGSAFVRVEEYKRPTFEVAAGRTRRRRCGSTSRRRSPGEARYYFGLPVTTGQRALARHARAGLPVVVVGLALARGRRADAQVIAQGKAALAADGTFRIRFTPEADERAGQATASTVDVPLRGRRRRHRRGRRDALGVERSFRLGFVAVEARVVTGDGVPARAAPGGAHDRPHRSRRRAARRARGAGGWPRSSQPRAHAAAGGAARASGAREDGHAYRDAGRRAAPALGRRLRPRRGRCAAGPTARERARGELRHDAKGGRGSRCRRCRPARIACATRRWTTFGATFETDARVRRRRREDAARAARPCSSRRSPR